MDAARNRLHRDARTRNARLSDDAGLSEVTRTPVWC
jgi:hypothetical protein